jgi:hypothetical protein
MTEHETDDDTLRQLQAELASRRLVKRVCERCDIQPFVASLREPNGPAGYEMLPDFAGYVKRCADCAAKPETTFAWIADIPFERFKKWTIEHPYAYALEELRVLLPAESSRGGLEFL